jgi:hypothetical protein
VGISAPRSSLPGRGTRSDDLERANIITRPRRRSRSSGAVLNTPAAPSPSTTPTASSNAERTLLPSDVMELSRSASADHVVGAGGRRLSRSGFNPFGHSGGLSSSFRLNSAGSSFRAGAGVPVSSSAPRQLSHDGHRCSQAVGGAGSEDELRG